MIKGKWASPLPPSSQGEGVRGAALVKVDTDEKSTIEIDFFIRSATSLIPIEVKANDNATRSLVKLTQQDGKYPDIRYGIKLCNKNIGFNGHFYTFPYSLTFLLKRFVRQGIIW